MNNFKIDLPAKIDGGVLKDIVDVLQRRGLAVTVHAQGIAGRRSESKPTHKIVLECQEGKKEEGA